VLLGLLPLAGATVELAEAEVAVDDERAHAESSSKRQRFPVMRFTPLDIGQADVGVGGAQLDKRGRLLPTPLLPSGDAERLARERPSLFILLSYLAQVVRK